MTDSCSATKPCLAPYQSQDGTFVFRTGNLSSLTFTVITFGRIIIDLQWLQAELGTKGVAFLHRQRDFVGVTCQHHAKQVSMFDTASYVRQVV